MWWESRQQPASPTIEQKLKRTPKWYLSKWNLSDVDAFFELCAGRVTFWGKPAQDITSIVLRDKTANVDIDLRLTGYQVNPGSNVAVHVDFDGLGEFEKIPPNRLNKAMLFPGGLVNTVPVWHPDMINEYPSELWAYFFVEVDFKELKAIFPPAEPNHVDISGQRLVGAAVVYEEVTVRQRGESAAAPADPDQTAEPAPPRPRFENEAPPKLEPTDKKLTDKKLKEIIDECFPDRKMPRISDAESIIRAKIRAASFAPVNADGLRAMLNLPEFKAMRDKAGRKLKAR